MAADYKSRVTSKQKKSLPGYVWLLSGLAIGLFIAFIVYLDKQPENENDFGSAVQLELEKLKQQAKSTTKNEKASTKESRPQKRSRNLISIPYCLNWKCSFRKTKPDHRKQKTVPPPLLAARINPRLQSSTSCRSDHSRTSPTRKNLKLIWLF